MKQSAALLLVALLAAALLVPSAQAVNYGTVGSKVLVTNSDFVPTLTATLPGTTVAEVIQRDIGILADGSDDAFYLHFGAAAGETSIAAGRSFRLTCGTTFTSSCPTNVKEGSWVEAGDSDLAAAAGTNLGGMAALVRFLEADGKPGWTPGDGLFLDVGATAGTLEAGTDPDVRLVRPAGGAGLSCGTCPIGRPVRAGDSDLVEAGDGDRVQPTSTAFSAGIFALFWFDGDNDGAVSIADAFYFKGPNAPTNQGATNTVNPDIGDARFAEAGKTPFGATVDFGTLVAAGQTDYKRTYALVAPGIAITNTADPDFPDQHAFLHWADPDGTNDHVRTGDVSLYRGPSGGGGTLVTAKGTSATSPGHGTGIDTYDAGLTGRLRYIDLSPTGFSNNDPVYVKRPGNVGGTVEIGDLRLTANAPYVAGSVVKTGDTADIGQTLVGPASLVFKRHDADGAQWVELKLLTTVSAQSGVKLSDTLGATTGLWEPGTEAIYVGGSTAVATGMIRLYHPTLASGPTVVVNCGTPDADCPLGAAPVGTLSSYSKLYVTGADATFDVGSSEYIYDSNDDKLSAGDRRVIAHPVGGAVASVVADADVDAAALSLASTDAVVVSWDPSCPGACSPFLRVGDVFVLGSAIGTRVTPSTTGFVPILDQPGTPVNLVRYNRGQTASASDDVFYASFTGSATLVAGDLRLTAITGRAAGTLIQSTDSTYAEEIAGNAQFTLDPAGLATRICFVNVDGQAGLSRDDRVVVEADTAVFGAPFGAVGTVTAYDIRVTPYPATGSPSFQPGTVILAGNTDLQGGQTACAAAPAGLSWFFRYFDANGNARFDASTTDADVGYLVLSTTLDDAPAPLHAIRVTGTGGSTSTGGGSNPPPPPPPVTPTPTPTPTPTDTTSPSPTPTNETTSPSPTPVSPSPTDSPTASPTSSPTGSPDPTGTGDEDDGEEDTPGVGLVALLGAIALALAARRRLP